MTCFLVRIDREGQPPQRVELCGRTRQSVLLAAQELHPDADRVAVVLRGEW